MSTIMKFDVEVDVDFNNKPPKFTSDAININRLYNLKLQEKEEKEGAERRSKIGTGDRSEKIRTYNYPQNRVTDHRIGYTTNSLDRVMNGKLDDIIEALITEDQRRKLAGE